MTNTINRTIPSGGYDMGTAAAGAILPAALKLSMSGLSGFCLQLIFSDLSSDVDGTFQLLASNDDGTTWSPVSQEVHVSGNSQTSYITFAGPGTGIAAAQLINLKYTKTAGSGKLRQVIMGTIAS